VFVLIATYTWERAVGVLVVKRYNLRTNSNSEVLLTLKYFPNTVWEIGMALAAIHLETGSVLRGRIIANKSRS